MSKRKIVLPRLAASFVLALLVLMLVTTSRQLYVLVLNTQTENYLDYWSELDLLAPEKFALTEEDLIEARAGARRVLTFSEAEGVADYLIAQARVEGWNNYARIKEGLQPDRNGQELALSAWRKAILTRPAWPYSWLDFALAKARVQQIDREFIAALQQATRLGAWELRVMTGVMRLGIVYKSWLTEDMQLEVDGNLRRLTALYPYGALQLANELGNVAETCAYLKRLERYPQTCD